MRNLAHFVILSTALLATACDEPTAAECVEADAGQPALQLAPPELPDVDVRWREQGPPEASYIQSWIGQPIGLEQFAAAVLACPEAGGATWLLTLSAYKPDAGQPARVVGLGGSTILGSDAWDCYRKHWIANGAISF